MNTKEVVKLSADSNYVPVKYFVMEQSIGNTLATTYLWLKLISYGIDTIENFDAYIASLNTKINKTGFQGTLNAYSVVALADVKSYTSPKTNHSMHPIG